MGQGAVGRLWLYSSTKVTGWVCSSASVAARGWRMSHSFEGLVEALDLAAGGWVIWGGVDLGDSESAEFVFELVASALAAGESGGEDHAVVSQG
jgi:hypothetical protein